MCSLLVSHRESQANRDESSGGDAALHPLLRCLGSSVTWSTDSRTTDASTKSNFSKFAEDFVFFYFDINNKEALKSST